MQEVCAKPVTIQYLQAAGKLTPIGGVNVN